MHPGRDAEDREIAGAVEDGQVRGFNLRRECLAIFRERKLPDPFARLFPGFGFEHRLRRILRHVPGLCEFEGGQFCQVEHVRDVEAFCAWLKTRVVIHAEVAHRMSGQSEGEGESREQMYGHRT